MKQPILKTVALLLAIGYSMHAKSKEHTPAQSSTNLPAGFEQEQTSTVTFTENKGQVSDQYNKPRPDVLFSGSVNGLTYHIRNNGISYQLTRVDSWKDADNSKMLRGMKVPQAKGLDEVEVHEEKQIPAQTTLYQVDIAWLNQNNNFTIDKGTPIAGYNNYYLTVCPNGVTHVQTYTDVTLKNIYNNIDLHYYEKNGALEYDYIVAPHADYHQIQLKIGGTTGIAIQKDGSLLLKTPLGNITENAPLVYQQGKALKATWVVKNNRLSFDIENYTPSLQLIIDPTVSRGWGTYYGGSRTEFGNSCATDPNNNVYMAGLTGSGETTILDTIASDGSHQYIFGGFYDAFLVKFNTAGERLWGTYYGGSGDDRSFSCSTDAFGNVYTAGCTATLGGEAIATTGSHQPTYGEGPPDIFGVTYDAFLVKFNTDGIRQWGTYYGGMGVEYGNSCTTDANGNVYLAGVTTTSGGDTIATPGSHQHVFVGGAIDSSTGLGGTDAFLVKFNADGVRQWGTYYGASGADACYSCATDAFGNVFMAGTTFSISDVGDTIATIGSHQPLYGGGLAVGDAFLVKFNSDGVRQWGTYYGSWGDEAGHSCATDTAGNVYMSGTVYVNDFAIPGGDTITTPGSHQPLYGGVGSYGTDAFLVKFNATGIRQWGTYYGGSDIEEGYVCTTDTSGNVYMSGMTRSADYNVIATPSAWQTIYAGAGSSHSSPEDAFLVKFNPAGVRQWGTYYGTSDDDEGLGCTTDKLGHIYVSGYTYPSTTDAIANSTSWQPTYGGGHNDAFLVQFCITSLDTLYIMPDGDTLVASAAATYKWYKDGVLIPGATTQSYLPAENGSYTVESTYHGETCALTSAPYNLTTGIHEHSSDNTISIYPNPNNGQFEIALQLNTQDNYTLELTNALGQVLYHEELKNYIGTYHKQLDETHYGAGIYLFRVKNSKEQSVKKVISF